MPNIIAALTIALLLVMVSIRALLLKRTGIQAVHFGKIDRKDFLIPPFAFFYFYLVFAAAFGLPSISGQEIFQSGAVSWIGATFCLVGLLLFLASLISFGNSFRVGIDEAQPDELVTSGVFAFSRNPIYLAFGIILLGQFLVFPSWILLLYLGAAVWLFHRQVLREEGFLQQHYGTAFAAYCSSVRRYF